MKILAEIDAEVAVLLGLNPSEEIRRLLHYSWKDIHFEYDGLTKEEKDVMSRETFYRLVPWVKKPL